MTTAAPTIVTFTVVSPMFIAGESAGGTPADIDVTTDRHGLPFIPRARVSARLRDSALGVVTAFPDLLEPALQLLGRVGSHHTRRLLTVGDAHLPDPVRGAVAATLDLHQGNPGAADRVAALITDALTTVEANTAVDRAGAPRRGSLRTARVVIPGVTFTADLTWREPPDPIHLTCLARIALGVTQLGMRGGRGRGAVDTTLGGDRSGTLAAADLPTDLTAGASR